MILLFANKPGQIVFWCGKADDLNVNGHCDWVKILVLKGNKCVVLFCKTIINAIPFGVFNNYIPQHLA